MHPTSPTGASEVESGAAAASDVLAPPPPPPPDVRPPVATMAPPLEEILNKLLMADNAVIQEVSHYQCQYVLLEVFVVAGRRAGFSFMPSLMGK